MTLLDPSHLLTAEVVELPPPPAPPPALEQLAFLVGGVWVARYQSGTSDGWRAESFEWDLDRQFIRARATVIGVSQPRASLTKGRFGVDPPSGLLLSWAFTAAGSYSESRQVIIPPQELAPPPGVPTWIFQGRTVSSTGTSQFTSTLSRLAEDRISTSIVIEGVGKPVQLAYERRR